MAGKRKTRRRSVQLYRDPSPWGVLAAIGFLVALIVVALVVFSSNAMNTLSP